jgi:hypothetical protein
MKWWRTVGTAGAVALLAGLTAPYIDAGGYRERIQNALERSLDRKVTVGKVRFNLLTGPGFTVEDVTIFDHPSIGIEPMAYVERLDARVRLTTLWTRSLSFSNLRLNNPTVNLAKSEEGVWNFQLLGRNTPAAREFPSIQVRSGRINFKFGDYKTIFYLSDSDVDVSPASPDRLDLRFSGQPSRTDQQAQSFGRLLARGVWRVPSGGPSELDFNVELERSSITDLARLVEGHAMRLHGSVSSRARISGPVTALNVKGQLRLDDVHRWDLAPARGGVWELQYQGSADLERQRIELQTNRQQNPDAPFLIRFRASEYLADPKFAATLEVNEAPASAFLDIARNMGASLPAGLNADGKVTGTVGYAKPGGLQGQFALQDSTVRFEETNAIELRRAEFVIDKSRIRVLPSLATVSATQAAEVAGEYDGDSGRLHVEVSTRGMDVSELQTGSEHLFGIGGVPVLEWCRQGTWRGSLRYQQDGGTGSWTGDFELKDARIPVHGLNAPLRLHTAHVHLDASGVTLSDIRGEAGTIPFRGEYIADVSPRRPHRLKLRIEEAELADIEALLMPSLRRQHGLFARFRIRKPQMPEWLRSRHLMATLSVESLKVGDQTWSVDHVRAVWEGAGVKLLGLAARNSDTELAGEIHVDLNGTAPLYRLDGKLEGLPYQGGTLHLEGVLEAQGFGAVLWDTARGTGTFVGDHVVLAPELEFRTMSGNVELAPGGKFRLSSIQAAQGLDAFSGQGSTQPDGRIVLDLTTGRRQVRVALVK